ncbi:hypothetical protein P22_3176 [Propionispora sp. 2/2-37]|uniref:PTS sugar transporter subunit IIB n=1 Tax=Propionispora sp. 2/2-37 TaxID=1677858 RepID=UPI0006BB5527|nr:cytochrome C biogenesis protein CcmE [Propionispora sp. 2/2-37]CUH97050.1 hypothetical protein P22_3176 [Propionispora sp. 2/2-37]
MNILLICATGLSTGKLVSKMQVENESGGYHHKIASCSFDNLKNYVEDFDVLLLGPQIRYKSHKVAKLAEEKNKKFAIIDSLSFIMGDGKAVLDQVHRLLQE